MGKLFRFLPSDTMANETNYAEILTYSCQMKLSLNEFGNEYRYTLDVKTFSNTIMLCSYYKWYVKNYRTFDLAARSQTLDIPT